jgi:hypothetical protein
MRIPRPTSKGTAVSQPLLGVRRACASVLIATGLAGGLAACGSDSGSSGSSASTKDVTLTATEYNFDLSATPSSDTKTIAFKNDGKELHELIFAKINKGFTVDQAYQLQGRKGSAEIVGQAGAKPGQAQKVTLKQPLAPGRFKPRAASPTTSLVSSRNSTSTERAAGRPIGGWFRTSGLSRVSGGLRHK